MDAQTLEVTLRLDGQVEVNQVIDALRVYEVGIVSLRRQKSSLESVFLDVVQNFSQS